MTSHDVVQWLRHLTGVEKVGHGGTLDPCATGVLPLGLGKATRLLEFFKDFWKGYRVEIIVGLTTASGDLEGEVLTCTSVPDLSEEQVEKVLGQFRGAYDQVPPMYSAVRHQGRRLYELARAGIEVVRQPRRVIIAQLRLLRLWRDGHFFRALLDVTCSGGTYVRSLCADIGERLGYGAAVGFLIRTSVGPFVLDRCYTLEELADKAFEKGLLPLDYPFAHLPAAKAHGQTANRILNGNPVSLNEVQWEAEKAPTPGSLVRLYNLDGELLALGFVTDRSSRLVMRKILGKREALR
jgi:tRNA pseudouridine55 synthase